MLRKSENLKFHSIDYCTGIINVVDNNYNFHIYILIMKVFLSLFLHSWMFFHPSEHYYADQEAQFENFLNQSATVLNCVFKGSSTHLQRATNLHKLHF